MTIVRTRSGADLSATEAKQGRRGRHVLVILVCALVLAAVAWAGVELWGEHIDPNKSSASAPTRSPSVSRDDTASGNQPTQSTQIDKTENNQQGITSKADQPNRDGDQN